PMFPTLSHFIEYLTGVCIPLPIQTIGVFVAFAFICGFTFFDKELKRKEQEGLVKPFQRTRVEGKPISTMEVVMNGVLGFILGYKLLHAVFNYSMLVQDPQGFLLSGEGIWLGGLARGGLFIYWIVKDRKSTR